MLEGTNSRNILATVALLPGITFREHPWHNSTLGHAHILRFIRIYLLPSWAEIRAWHIEFTSCPPLSKTWQLWITRQSTAATYPEELAEPQALAAVRKVLDDKDTPEYISMDDLLLNAGISSDIYLCGLKICSKGNSVVMQRKPSESWINMYNPNVIRVWRANMDLQNILDPYVCVMYIPAYMLNLTRVNAQWENY